MDWGGWEVVGRGHGGGGTVSGRGWCGKGGVGSSECAADPITW